MLQDHSSDLALMDDPPSVADGDEPPLLVSSPKHGSYCLDGLVAQGGEVRRMIAGAARRETHQFGTGSECVIRFQGSGDANRFMGVLQRIGLMATLCEAQVHDV